MNFQKMGELEVGLRVVVDGNAIKQVDIFVYLDGTAHEDGGSSRDTQRRLSG